MRRQIPNFITILNLCCGVMACISAMDQQLRIAAVFIALGAVFDLLDGLVARALGVSSAIGKQLDSLADLISFGLAPALIARELIFRSLYLHSGEVALQGFEQALPYLPLIVVACAAIRLARFNIDQSTTLDFKGLPTPANALFWIAIPLSASGHDHAQSITALLDHPYVLSGLCVFLGALMISTIPLLSMKFNVKDRSRLNWQMILLIGSGILFWFFRFAALPLIIVLYLLLSLIRNTTIEHEIQS